MALVENGLVKHLRWTGATLRFLDQTLLPRETKFIETDDFRVICDGLKRLAIRGAPAIGIAAGYALTLAARQIKADDPAVYLAELDQCRREIASARPTAVNLFWALDRLMAVIPRKKPVSEIRNRLEEEAKRIHEEDVAMCRALSREGSELMPAKGGVMTICNAGGLATGGYGTALGVIHTAYQNGKQIHVLVNETRPLLQGARLTTWELREAEIPFTLLTDNMAAAAMAQGMVQCLIVGADRIARNGDTANKIGTYSLAVLARYHKIPFYVAAPTSTIDGKLHSGKEIPIEYRDPREVTHPLGVPAAPSGLAGQVFNPAFDVTPAELITAIITERGISRHPYKKSLSKMV